MLMSADLPRQQPQEHNHTPPHPHQPLQPPLGALPANFQHFILSCQNNTDTDLSSED